MKVLRKIFKIVNASDEFKSTLNMCLKWTLPDHTRRDPKFVERTWRHYSRASLFHALFCFRFWQQQIEVGV